jgi:hypothetical protein
MIDQFQNGVMIGLSGDNTVPVNLLTSLREVITQLSNLGLLMNIPKSAVLKDITLESVQMTSDLLTFDTPSLVRILEGEGGFIVTHQINYRVNVGIWIYVPPGLPFYLVSHTSSFRFVRAPLEVWTI